MWHRCPHPGHCMRKKYGIYVRDVRRKNSEAILSVGGSKTRIFDFYIFSGETKNWITIARSVLYCWKSDRIIFSNIQIHCYWSFELPIKNSLSLWRVSLELRHFDNFFRENPSSYDILSIFFMAKPHISVKWAPKCLNKNGNDQSLQMYSLISAFVIWMRHNTGFLMRWLSLTNMSSRSGEFALRLTRTVVSWQKCTHYDRNSSITNIYFAS